MPYTETLAVCFLSSDSLFPNTEIRTWKNGGYTGKSPPDAHT